jgi:hypothetical protein
MMKGYKYEAVDKHGNHTEGVVQAASLEEVILKLMAAEKYPSRVEELTSASYAAFTRVEKLKRIRNKLDPQPIEAESLPPPQKQRRYSAIAWTIFILAWVVVVVAYVMLK